MRDLYRAWKASSPDLFPFRCVPEQSDDVWNRLTCTSTESPSKLLRKVKGLELTMKRVYRTTKNAVKSSNELSLFFDACVCEWGRGVIVKKNTNKKNQLKQTKFYVLKLNLGLYLDQVYYGVYIDLPV